MKVLDRLSVVEIDRGAIHGLLDAGSEPDVDTDATISPRPLAPDSGRAALEILERREPCDLMIVDLVMPGLSGLDTVHLARRSRPHVKVLFVSGYADLSRFGGSLNNYPLLKKPFNRENLAEAVHTATQGVSLEASDNVVALRRDQF